MITTDGGQTFQTVLTIIGQFSSFLRAGDGTVYAGTMGGQLYVRPPGATTFTNHSAPHFRCLGQRPGTSRIFACGDQGLDGFDVGYSDDYGGTFTRMSRQTARPTGRVSSRCSESATPGFRGRTAVPVRRMVVPASRTPAPMGRTPDRALEVPRVVPVPRPRMEPDGLRSSYS